MILFRFAQAGRYIFQIYEKKSHISPIVWQSQKCPQLPLSTILFGVFLTCLNSLFALFKWLTVAFLNTELN